MKMLLKFIETIEFHSTERKIIKKIIFRSFKKLYICMLETENQKIQFLFSRAFVILKKNRIFATAFEKRSSSSVGRAHPF